MQAAASPLILILLAAPPALAGTNPNSYEILENGAGKFTISHSAVRRATPNIEWSTPLEDLTLDEREAAPGYGADYPAYAPGDASFGSATVRAHVGASSQDLYQAWLQRARDGATGTITIVIAPDPDPRSPVMTGGPGQSSAERVLTFVDARIEGGRLSAVEGAPDLVEEVIDITFGCVEFEAWTRNDRATVPAGGVDAIVPLPFTGVLDRPRSEPTVGPDFAVEIGPAGTGTPASDAELRALVAQLRLPATPGHAYVDTLTLRGPLAAARRAVSAWMADIGHRTSTTRTITLTEISRDGRAGRSYTLPGDCTALRYVAPAFSADGRAVVAHEELTVRCAPLPLP